MTLIPYRPEHVLRIAIQGRQANMQWMSSHYLDALFEHGPAITVEHEGVILACAGVAIKNNTKGTLWSFLSKDAGKHFVRIHKCALRFLSTIPYPIEAMTEVDFPQGCRWLTLLGFQREAVLSKAGPNGEDYFLYARG